MSSLREGMAHLHKSFEEIEKAANKLQNKNFADIVRSARGRLHQLANHPDADEVSKHMDAAEVEKQPVTGEQGFDPKAGVHPDANP